MNLDDLVTDRIRRLASSKLCEVPWRTLVRWEQMRKVPLRSVAAAYVKGALEAQAIDLHLRLELVRVPIEDRETQPGGMTASISPHGPQRAGRPSTMAGRGQDSAGSSRVPHPLAEAGRMYPPRARG